MQLAVLLQRGLSFASHLHRFKHDHQQKGEEKWHCSWCSTSAGTVAEFAIAKHEASEAHRNKAQKHALTGSMDTCLRTLDASHESALLSAFEHIYFLAKEEIPNRKYESLRDFSISQGNDKFKALENRRASYTSPTFFREALFAISNELASDIAQMSGWHCILCSDVNLITLNRRASPFFSVTADECTDVTVIEQLSLFVRGIDPNTVLLFSVLMLSAASL